MAAISAHSAVAGCRQGDRIGAQQPPLPAAPFADVSQQEFQEFARFGGGRRLFVDTGDPSGWPGAGPAGPRPCSSRPRCKKERCRIRSCVLVDGGPAALVQLAKERTHQPDGMGGAVNTFADARCCCRPPGKLGPTW